MVRHLRQRDSDTPYVLMGYYNPIYRYGADAFARDAVAAGVDGAIVVDLPPEEDAELADPARAAGLAMVRLATPTSDEARLPAIVGNAGGFLYYVAITGITGTRSADAAAYGPPSPGCAASASCRSPSALASRPRRRPPRWRGRPTPRWSARSGRARRPSTSIRTVVPSPASSRRCSPTSARWPPAFAPPAALPHDRNARGPELRGVGSIVAGLIIMLAAAALLFWNKGHALSAAQALAEGGGLVTTVDSTAVEPRNEGRLVFLTGTTTTAGLRDDDLGLDAKACG